MSGPATPSGPPDERPSPPPPSRPPSRRGFPLADLIRGARAAQAIVAVDAAVFVALWAGDALADPQALRRWGALVILGGEVLDWWRILTSGFLHFGIGHLLLNLFGITVFGAQLERRWGVARFLVLFLGAIAAGGALQVALDDGPTIAGGASGGVFGAIGAWVAVAALSRERRAQGQLVSILVFAAVALMLGFSDPQVGNIAHGGGLAWGLGAGLALEAERRRRAAPG